ncbi:MAG: type 4a pilus biogenesis protein PilO [Rhodocyclaceae bacterium]|nr:type 4a pilus biogenesis protein PilO [Rhodocyclaceae bacterium]
MKAAKGAWLARLRAIDLQRLRDEFRALDPKDPGAWPLLPRITVLVGLFVFLLFLAAWLGWQGQWDDLELRRQEEAKLKEEWLNKKRQAVNLDAYRQQLAEIERAFGAMLKQLPNAAEVESLLLDINQAGLGRGLQFELFKPGTEAVKDFYAELPITISVTGSYHDFGAFAGDLAKLPRIVTLNDIQVTPLKEGGGRLTMTAQAKTFRYLDEAEIAARKKAEDAAKKGGAKK